MGNGWWAIALFAPITIAQPVASPPELAGATGTRIHPIESLRLAQRSRAPSRRVLQSYCPDTLESLMPLLLRDLPSYANRVIARSRSSSRATDLPPSYVLLAGSPDYRPLPASPEELGLEEYRAIAPEDQPQQVFFTTLERQYGHGGYAQLQGFYWLFLTQQADQWHLVGLLSSWGSYPQRQPASPPRDSSEGVVAQAIRLWLRDCRAGSVRVRSALPGLPE
ncbi:hypothetical protein [Leptolyngbya sp. O-77]|uniref:hypothetical protein n=1 Tax=Leptolyngbya sp. O-77 TaxID=1080068 RepID=UPI00074D47B5|nr:hypothetical protein [Leptolyngbya sp. O-77]BAU41801.1 hypothetical protein O77CONTIG1_01614 [Leptolyngbya sp. O-77]